MVRALSWGNSVSSKNRRTVQRKEHRICKYFNRCTKDQEKWSKFVTEKQLGGIQLLAENEWESQFLKAYGVFSVPTFILLDPAGNIVNANAPKPSDDKLIDLFNSLKI